MNSYIQRILTYRRRRFHPPVMLCSLMTRFPHSSWHWPHSWLMHGSLHSLGMINLWPRSNEFPTFDGLSYVKQFPYISGKNISVRWLTHVNINAFLQNYVTMVTLLVMGTCKNMNVIKTWVLWSPIRDFFLQLASGLYDTYVFSKCIFVVIQASWKYSDKVQ